MKLVTPNDGHLSEMMNWFPDRRSCAIWAGPEFRYPFDATSFREGVRLDLPSYSLVDDRGALAAFGQYYLRAARCHLARLVVSPIYRARGLGYALIRELSRIGRGALNVTECSLFVMEDNTPARRLYERMGFASTPYPENDLPHVHGMLYMVASRETADSWECGN